MNELDDRLRRTLARVDAPGGFAERVLARRAWPRPPSSWRRGEPS